MVYTTKLNFYYSSSPGSLVDDVLLRATEPTSNIRKGPAA